jgi:hypothetical protein
MGFYGNYLEMNGDNETYWDWLYETMRLFVLDRAAVGGTAYWNIWLQIARFLAPILVAYAAIRSVLILVREHFSNRRLQTLSGHVVICGLGERGHRLAKQYLNNGRIVVCVDNDALNPVLAELRELGAYVVIRDAGKSETLSAARVVSADTMIVVTSSDEKNASIVRAARQCVSARGNKNALKCFAHSSNVALELFEEFGLMGERSPQFEFHPFCVAREAARLALSHYPPYLAHFPKKSGERPLHVAVLGFGKLAREIVRQVIRTCHFPDMQNVRITVVSSREDRSKWDCFVQETPALGMVADVSFHSKAPLEVTRDEWRQLQKDGDFHCVYVGLGESVDGLRLARELPKRLQSRATNEAGPSLVICRFEAGISIDLGSRRQEQLSAPGLGSLKYFSISDEAISLEAVIREHSDQMARFIHEDYLAQQSNMNEAEKARLRWELLGTDDRDSSRDQADHLWIKLACLDYISPAETIVVHREIAPEFFRKSFTVEAEVAELLEAQPERLELLARIEHRRWMASKIVTGWEYDSVRNKELKHHHCIVEFERLDAVDKQKDVDVILNVPHLLGLVRKITG